MKGLECSTNIQNDPETVEIENQSKMLFQIGLKVRLEDRSNYNILGARIIGAPNTMETMGRSQALSVLLVLLNEK